MHTATEPMSNTRTGEFLSKLSPAARENFETVQSAGLYPAGVVLFEERQKPSGIFLVLSGEVKLSMNSSDGKRLILRIARAGEILGLAATMNDGRCEYTAETLHPARIAVVGRTEFFGFLRRHPEAYQPLAVELSRHLNIVCGQLRTVGLSSSAPEKLARLLLDWSQNGQTTEAGTRFHFPLTHEEIGEFIGASRETVTRTLSIFKTRRLVACSGAMLTIVSRIALEDFARCRAA